MDIKPLQPLSFGQVLIVGAKTSNIDEELRTHPRVIVWDSQNEHWSDKDLPTNVRAVFVTRWIGHVAFGKILSEARKRHITIFNPEGTGMIMKQVRELLDMNRQNHTIEEQEEPVVPKNNQPGKLAALLPFVDWSKNNAENARSLIGRCGELGISSTVASITQFVAVQRRRRNNTPKIKRPNRVKAGKTADVSVQLFDEALKQFKDMRDFFVAVVKENNDLKQKLSRFKRALED